MKKIILFVLAIGLFVACSNSLDRPFNEETIKEDVKVIKESGDADSTEMMLMAMYIMKSQFTQQSLDGMTYADILEKAKEEQKEKKADEGADDEQHAE